MPKARPELVDLVASANIFVEGALKKPGDKIRVPRALASELVAVGRATVPAAASKAKAE